MQGFNMGRYHPPASLDPDLDTKRSRGFNRNANGSSTQGSGPPTVRFEMPFAIWCTNCQPEQIIGQGVRFNAQKVKVGNYYTSPIWAFRIKHTLCGGPIEIRTDPQAGDYVVQEGGKRRDYGEDNESKDGIFGEILSAEERERRVADPFAGLESKVEQGHKAKTENELVEDLRKDRDRDWDDVWSANRRLRSTFRVERKVLEEKQKNSEALADRMSLGFQVLDEAKEDGQRAALVRFGESEEIAQRQVVVSASRPLFEGPSAQSTQKLPRPPGKTKAELRSEAARESLRGNLSGSTRAVVDPFLSSAASTRPRGTVPTLGIKRKRKISHDELVDSKRNANEPSATEQGPTTNVAAAALVGYESDG